MLLRETESFRIPLKAWTLYNGADTSILLPSPLLETFGLSTARIMSEPEYL